MSKIISLGKIDISKACHVSVVYQNIVVVLMSKIIYMGNIISKTFHVSVVYQNSVEVLMRKINFFE